MCNAWNKNLKKNSVSYVFYNFFSCQIPLLIYIKDAVKKMLLTIVCRHFLPYKVRCSPLSFRPFKKCKQWWRISKQCQPIIFYLKKNSTNEIICVYPTKGYQKSVFPDLTDPTKSVWLCSCTGLNYWYLLIFTDIYWYLLIFWFCKKSLWSQFYCDLTVFFPSDKNQ